MGAKDSKAVGTALALVAFVTMGAFGAAAETAGVRIEPERSAEAAAAVATLASDRFGESASPANAWYAVGGACLTAGTAATPASSIPACRAAAPIDARGSGALQLTPSRASASGMVVLRAPIATSNGLQVTFDDESFGGSTPGADGLVLFFSNAAGGMPTTVGGPGGSLGYANGSSGAAKNGPRPGIANGFVGIGFDEYGNYSMPAQGRLGGPGRTPETIAVRGAASAGYPYLGGVVSASGAAISLPFALDRPTVRMRPTQPPTITASLTPAGRLTVGVDRHDGRGYVGYLDASVGGTDGQPAVPPFLYVGLVASTSGNFNRHQITRFSVLTLLPPPTPVLPTKASAAAAVPAPTTVPTAPPGPSNPL